jgi:hypothetical protein
VFCRRTTVNALATGTKDPVGLGAADVTVAGLELVGSPVAVFATAPDEVDVVPVAVLVVVPLVAVPLAVVLVGADIVVVVSATIAVLAAVVLAPAGDALAVGPPPPPHAASTAVARTAAMQRTVVVRVARGRCKYEVGFMDTNDEEEWEQFFREESNSTCVSSLCVA